MFETFSFPTNPPAWLTSACCTAKRKKRNCVSSTTLVSFSCSEQEGHGYFWTQPNHVCDRVDQLVRLTKTSLHLLSWLQSVRDFTNPALLELGNSPSKRTQSQPSTPNSLTPPNVNCKSRPTSNRSSLLDCGSHHNESCFVQDSR